MKESGPLFFIYFIAFNINPKKYLRWLKVNLLFRKFYLNLKIKPRVVHCI